MSEYLEIAFAVATNSLCFFTGTGFTKAITDGNAPSWQDLLSSLCDLVTDGENLKDALFPSDSKNPVSLEEAAQIIDLRLHSQDTGIHDEVAAKIKALKLSSKTTQISSFLAKNKCKVITTNYDKLFEELAGVNRCHSYSPGLPIPRSKAEVEVYHVHGSVDSPSNMVITSEDYYKFLNVESYFSRKLSTVLHESLVVILGYSLSDTNLKALISDYRGLSKSLMVSSSLFLVSRKRVHQDIKDYYSHCYGIRVLDGTEIHEFFNRLELAMLSSKDGVEKIIEGVGYVLDKGYTYKREYLKVEKSFYVIVASISAIGRSLSEPRVAEVIGYLIKEKITLTGEDGAWSQYEQLARWLIHIASKFEVRNTGIETVFIDAVYHSMRYMSKKLVIGYSWHAYSAWEKGWLGILPANRVLIRQQIRQKLGSQDALSIIEQG